MTGFYEPVHVFRIVEIIGPCFSYFRVVSAIWERNQLNLYVVVCSVGGNALQVTRVT